MPRDACKGLLRNAHTRVVPPYSKASVAMARGVWDPSDCLQVWEKAIELLLNNRMALAHASLLAGSVQYVDTLGGNRGGIESPSGVSTSHHSPIAVSSVDSDPA